MAVHLNAPLKTRFIPFLFTIAVLASAFVAIARASEQDLDDAPSELRAVMSEGVDPGRLDRRPGFSPIVYAPRVGEHPWVGSLPASDDEETPEPSEDPGVEE
jgi:hypothetical protein